MKSGISNHKNQTYKSKLLSKICRLKKIISVIIYLNKEFEKNTVPQSIKNTLLPRK